MNTLIDYSILRFRSLDISIRDLIVITVLFFVFRISLWALKKIFQHRSRVRKVDFHLHYFSIYVLLKYVAWIFFVYFSLSYVGVNLTLFVASSAALFVGVGLGLQETFKDFLSGLVILLEGTIRIGDIVEVEGRVVKVEEIKLRTSRVINRDEIVMIIPNHKFINDNVINWSHSQKPARFSVEVGVDYSSDVRLVEELLYQIAVDHKAILSDGEYKAFVRFKDFADSALVFELVFFSQNTFRVEKTKSEVRFMMLEAFTKNGIKLPFPQRDVHLYTTTKA